MKTGEPTEFDHLSTEKTNIPAELEQDLIATLAFPRSKGYSTRDADACNTRIGCMLMQNKLDGWKKQLSYSLERLMWQNRVLTRRIVSV